MKSNKLCLILVFFLFSFIRFFLDFKYYFIYGDSLRYLTLAKTFPYHLYWNDSFYILHPPIYPYLIHIFNFIVQDYMAAILISFFFSVISFIVLVKLFRLLKKKKKWIIVFMLFIALNQRHVFFSNTIMKESMIFALFWLAVYFFIKGLKKSNINFIYSGILSVLLVLTTDLAVTIFPVYILTFIFFIKKKKIIPSLFSFLSASAAYLFWLLLKLRIYLKYVYYPIDWGITKTVNFSLLQIHNPAFFPIVSSIISFHSTSSLILFIKHLRYFFAQILNIVRPFDIPLIPVSSFELKEVLLLILVYLPIVVFMIIAMFKAIISLFKKFRIHNNLALYFILLSIILLIPIIQIGSVPRYSFPVIVPLTFFVVEGIFMFLNRLKIKTIRFMPLLIVLLLIFFLPYWLFSNPVPITSLKSEVMGAETSYYINNLEGKSVMSFWLPLTYLIDKKEIPLHPFPEELDIMIKEYGIDYIAFYLDYNNPYFQLYKRTIDYIFEHPEKYKLLKIIEENYNEHNYDLVPKNNNKFYVFSVEK